MSAAGIVFLVLLVVFVVHSGWAYSEAGPKGWGGHLILAIMLGLLGWKVFGL